MRRAIWNDLAAAALLVTGIGVGTGPAKATVTLSAEAWADYTQFGTSCYDEDVGSVGISTAAANPSECGGFMASATATASGGLAASATASAPNSSSWSEGYAYADQSDWGVVTVPGNGVAQITIVDQVTSDVSGLIMLYEGTDEYGDRFYVSNAEIIYTLWWEEGPTGDCDSQSCDIEIENSGDVAAYSPTSPDGCIDTGINCLSVDGGTTTLTQTFTIANGDGLYIFPEIYAYAYAGGGYPDSLVTASIDDPIEILVPAGVTVDWDQSDIEVITEAPANSVPEPPSLLLFAMALAAAAGAMRLRRRRG